MGIALNKKHIQYYYDQAGFLTSTTYPDGSTTVDITPDWAGRIEDIYHNATTLIASYYYIGSRVARRTYNTTTAVNSDYSYDNLGRVTAIQSRPQGGSDIAHFTYTYVDGTANIDTQTYEHRPGDPYADFDYDNLDRLGVATYIDDSNEVFTMDDLGNRAEVNLRNGTDEVYDVNDIKNQYMAIDDIPLEYDAVGNLTEDKDGYQYEYDYENRLVKIIDVNDIDVATFDYDALGRRIRKVDSKANETTLYYYNENWQVLAEYDGSGVFQKMNVFGNYIDELLYRRGTIVFFQRFYVHDHLYSPVASITAAGNVNENYEYDAYGNCTIWNSDFTTERDEPADNPTYPNPYLFTGRRIDYLDKDRNGDPRLEIMYYRNRYYDTETGRFLQHDPLGYVDSMNLYEYAQSKPVTVLDPMGQVAIVIGGVAIGMLEVLGISLAVCLVIPTCRNWIIETEKAAWGLGVCAASAIKRKSRQYYRDLRRHKENLRRQHPGKPELWIVAAALAQLVRSWGNWIRDIQKECEECENGTGSSNDRQIRPMPGPSP